MAGNRILLDTNIISALLKGDVAVADMIDAATEVFISVVVVGELHYGAQYSEHVAKNVANIHKVTTRYQVLDVDDETAETYGSIKSSLRKKGRPIPENDVWIASVAIRHKLSLITRDKHFDEVNGLKVIVC